MKRWANTERSLPAALLLLALLGLCELVSKAAGIPAYRLPAPSAIGIALYDHFGLLASHAQTTLAAVAAGLILALAAALAFSMYRLPALKQALIAVVILVCFFPPAVNLMEGLEQTSRPLSGRCISSTIRFTFSFTPKPPFLSL
ncbi:MAG: hypothetical protein AB1767_11070 [Bacillota bacterium]